MKLMAPVCARIGATPLKGFAQPMHRMPGIAMTRVHRGGLPHASRSWTSIWKPAS